MNTQELMAALINNTITDTYRLIDCLYITCNLSEKNRLLNQLRRNMNTLCRLLAHLQEISLQPPEAPPAQLNALPAANAAPVQTSAAPPTPAVPMQTMPLSVRAANTNSFLQPQRSFTPPELARYNGKDGYPAFIAVNGTVYDVTNNPTWGAASHFGLWAGSDVTQGFYSCHAGQQVLSKLKIVGMMTE